jgi:ElaB/YqjD/DUF883 family membrane-anchored ribosome-binding protein
MSHAKDRMRNAIGERAADSIAEKTNEMISHARGIAGEVLDQSRERYRQAAQRAEEGFRQAGAVVRENPGLMVTAAVGIGLAVGVLIGLSMATDRRWSG